MATAIAVCFASGLAGAAPIPIAAEGFSRVDPALARLAMDDSAVEILIALPVVEHGPAPSGLFARAERISRQRSVFDTASSDLMAWLAARGFEHRSLWIANTVWARVPVREIAVIAARADVRFLSSNPVVRGIEPESIEGSGSDTSAPASILGIEWGVDRIRAPQVWALGNRGEGAVVAGADTGYQWDHPALRSQYRGWDPKTETATHDYQWHDAIHGAIAGGGNPCGFDTTAPCDDNSHGTHTMGTMVGDDGDTNQIGVAPGARWIGCRNMDRGNGRPSTYLECMQFFAAPTDLRGNSPRPDLAPNVINNSWGCPASEECSAQTDVLMSNAIRSLLDLGILFVVSAGNSGSGCSSVNDPPATLPESFTVGSTMSQGPDDISPFSSRGPVNGRLAPDISAPGSNVRSAVPNGGYGSKSGTSMAGPHVAGAAALLISAVPALADDPDRVRRLLEANAVPRTSTQNCGPFPGAGIPNAVFGHGRLDAWAAVDVAAPLFADGFDDG